MSENLELRCPDCREEMCERIERGIAIDHCNGCRGLWFDKNELDRYYKLNARVAPSSLTHMMGGKPAAESMACVRCTDRWLQEATIQKIAIRLCPVCQGVFVPFRSAELIAYRAHDDPKPQSTENDAIGDWITGSANPDHWIVCVLEFLIHKV